MNQIENIGVVKNVGVVKESNFIITETDKSCSWCQQT